MKCMRNKLTKKKIDSCHVVANVSDLQKKSLWIPMLSQKLAQLVCDQIERVDEVGIYGIECITFKLLEKDE